MSMQPGAFVVRSVVRPAAGMEEMLEPILQYAAEDVEPTFHPIGDLSNVMRSDAVDADRALATEDALANAGAARDGQFRVPSILGGGDR